MNIAGQFRENLVRTGLVAAILSVALASLSGCKSGEPVAQSTPELVKVCRECHGPGGSATIPGWQPLAGMEKQQIIAKLTVYRDKLNQDSVMTGAAHRLTDQQIEELADYYSSLGQP